MIIVVEDKVAKIYVEGQELPQILQPHWPNGTPFASDEEAQTWAEQYVEFCTDPNALRDQSGPNEERQARVNVDIREARIRATGILPEDIEWIIQRNMARGTYDPDAPVTLD